MIDLNSLDKNSIIICPFRKKEPIVFALKEYKDLKVKFITKQDLINGVYFTYDDNSIAYLMSKGYSYDVSKEILDNLIFLNEGTKKLETLCELKKELNEKNLLHYNYYFKFLFNNKKVYIYGYSKLDQEIVTALNKLGVSFEYLEEENEVYHHDYYEFEGIEDELRFVFNDICKKVSEGVSLSDISLYTSPEEYMVLVNKYAFNYGIPIFQKNYMTLYESPIFKYYLDLLNDGDFIDAFEVVEEKTKVDAYKVLPRLVKLINEVLALKDVNIDKISYMVAKSKTITLSPIEYKESLSGVDHSYRGNKYVYILGFSLGDYPIVKKDTDFLSDEEKILVGRNTSKIDNAIKEEELISFINENPNLIITKKNKVGKDVYYDSLLIKKLKMNRLYIVDDGIRFSDKLTSLEVSSYNDEYNAYGVDHPYLLGVDPRDIRYGDFDHDFKHCDKFKNDKKLMLSYSSVNDYSSCPFKYFYRRIAKIPFEDTFSTNLGNLFHHILEGSLKGPIDMDDYKDEIEKNFVTPKDRFYLNKLLPQVFDVIKKNEEHMEHSSFKKAEPEHEMIYELDNKTYIKGYSDKVLLNEENHEAILVDYKTYNVEFKADRVEYGLSLQLPTYGLLLKNEHPDYKVVGLYIQRVKVKKYDEEKSYRLKGVTINDNEVVHHLDNDCFSSSKYIEGISFKVSGELKANSSLIDEKMMNDLISKCEEIFIETAKKIRDGEFKINPYKINDKESPCKDCPLSAICFHTVEDYRRINLKDDKEEE